MTDLHHTDCTVECRELGDGRYEAIIAVNSDVGDGTSVDLDRLEFDAYMKNPIVHYAHDFRAGELPVGRTTNLRWDSDNRLIAEFEFLPDDGKAERVANAWKRGFLRAASITWQDRFGKPPRLREWSIVAMPADVDAVRGIVDLNEDMAANTGGQDMNETQIREAVAAALKERSETVNLADSVSEAVITAVKDTVDAAFAERDKAAADAVAAETALAEREASAAKAEEEMQARVQARADLIVRCQGLLPEGFTSTGKTTRDIMVEAVGGEIDNLDARSDDYIEATLDGILKRRSQAVAEMHSPVVRPQSGAPAFGTLTREPTLHDIRSLAEKGGPN